MQLFGKRFDAAEFLLIPDFSGKEQGDFPVVNIFGKVKNVHFNTAVVCVFVERGTRANILLPALFFVVYLHFHGINPVSGYQFVGVGSHDICRGKTYCMP